VQAAENTTTQQNVFEKNIVGPEISVCVPSELSGNILAENSMALSSNPTRKDPRTSRAIVLIEF